MATVKMAGSALKIARPASNSCPMQPQKTEAAPVSSPNNTNQSTGPLQLQLQLLHNPGLSAEWSSEEQNILDDGLIKYASEVNLWKYIKIAALLPEKTVRDVAMRCRWMTKKEMGKRRKAEEQGLAKKPKEKKVDLVSKSTPTTISKSVPMYTTPPMPIDNDDGISNDAIGGTAGELFEQNVQVMNQIRANLAACKLQENTELLARFRDNIFAIFNGISNVPGIMSQMPPLPVSVNTDLADTILPKSMHALQP